MLSANDRPEILTNLIQQAAQLVWESLRIIRLPPMLRGGRSASEAEADLEEKGEEEAHPR